MSQPARPPHRPTHKPTHRPGGQPGLGWIVSTSAAVVRRNATVLALLGILLSGLPAAGFNWAFQVWNESGGDEQRSAFAGSYLASFVLGSVIGGWLLACVTAVVAADLNGERGADVLRGASLRMLLREAVPVAGIAALAAVATLAASVLLVVPGLVLAVVLAFAVPARVAEGLEAWQAFRRSAALVRGNAWPCACIFLLWWATVLFRVVVPNLFAPAGGLGPAGRLVDGTVSAVGDILADVAIVVAYLGIRRIREGLRLEQAAGVFS